MGEMVFLDVPYHEKDEAKRLGARWDPEVRKWYIPMWSTAGRFLLAL